MLKALGLANVAVLSILAILLLRAPSPPARTLGTSPLALQRLEACRYQISQTLLDTGLAGLVRTQPDGIILVQIQRARTPALGPTATANPRLDADGTTWAALEAVASANSGECLGFNTITITVILQSPGAPALHATAHVALSDLFSWSLGEIDDAELAQRLDYQPPATLTPTPSPQTQGIQPAP